MLSQGTLERRARQLLREQGISGPSVNVHKIANRLGIEVRAQASTDSEISGAIMRDGKKVIIGVNADNQWERQRFTVAHELGHFLLHDDNLRVDRHFVDAPRESRLRIAAFRDRVSSQATDPREIEANRFAAALLIPMDFLEKSIRAAKLPLNDDALDKLAMRYEVSSQAMTYRLINLGVPLDYAGQR